MNNLDPDNLKELDLGGLKTQLQQRLDEILNAPGKKPLPIEEGRARINTNLKRELDADATGLEALPVVKQNNADGTTELVDPSAAFENAAKRIVQETVTFENFDNWFPVAILEMIHKGILGKDEISNDNAIGLAKLYQYAKAAFNKVKAARLRGDFAYEQAFHQSENQVQDSRASEAGTKGHTRNVKDKSLRISELINRYCETQIKDNAWRTHMLQDHKGTLENLVDILGDVRIDTITRKNMRDFRDTLELLPPSRKKKKEYQGKTIKEIIRMEPDTKLSVKTVNGIVQAVASMFGWAIREGFMLTNPAQGLSKRDEQAVIDKRECFTKEDIEAIFYDGTYVPQSFKNPAFYWVPLIGLYTGMRLEEICQLYCSDIYKNDENLWLIDIKTTDRAGKECKKVKNPNACRQIPMHPELIRLGLLSYMEKIQSSSERLFPELRVTDKTRKYGKQVGKNFSNLIKKKGITGKKSFHSLRHTFANYFKVHHQQTDVFRQVFGHEINELAARQYGARFSAKQCYDEIIAPLNYLQ